MAERFSGGAEVTRKLGKLPPIKKREIPFERRLQIELKRRDVSFIKLKPTVRGMPDRLAIGYGRMRLVEIKREDGDLSGVQKEFRKMLIDKHGVRVVVVRGPHVKTAADAICKWLA